jgi:hypothetical protein
MEEGDIDLISLLVSAQLSPLQITQIMSQLKGSEFGTILTKQVYDINQKTEELLNLALGLLPDCSDAVKTIAKLENKGVNHFYIVHEEGELFACSRGSPTKELTRLRLECPQQINDYIQALRDDFLLNGKSKMLVLVSIATDEMICLVSMYPDVWFMDTTAGKFFISIHL